MADNPAVPLQQVYEALLDDLKDGNCPGTDLIVGKQTVWLHTSDDVEAWLKACLRDGVGSEPVDTVTEDGGE